MEPAALRLAAAFDAEVIGLDPSAKMLECAQQRRGDARVGDCRGQAEAIPVSAGAIDLVFMSMSVRHFRMSSWGMLLSRVRLLVIIIGYAAPAPFIGLIL